eukprot:13079992-Alexandrium_andersonii.AAC.1
MCLSPDGATRLPRALPHKHTQLGVAHFSPEGASSGGAREIQSEGQQLSLIHISEPTRLALI